MEKGPNFSWSTLEQPQQNPFDIYICAYFPARPKSRQAVPPRTSEPLFCLVPPSTKGKVSGASEENSYDRFPPAGRGS